MAGFEAHLLKCLIIRGATRQPVSCAEGLQLANSIIDGTISQAQLILWKKKRMGAVEEVAKKKAATRVDPDCARYLKKEAA
jgi:hypothetical protein